MLKTPVRNQNVFTARNICVIDVTSVKRCRAWSDAASETRRLVWVYTFCIRPKAPFRMTLAISYCFILLNLLLIENAILPCNIEYRLIYIIMIKYACVCQPTYVCICIQNNILYMGRWSQIQLCKELNWNEGARSAVINYWQLLVNAYRHDVS